MQVTLNLLERIHTLDIMPQETSWVNRQVIKGLAEKIGVTAEDQEEFAIKESEPDAEGRTRTKWNDKGKEQRPFDLHAKEIALIHQELVKLDKAEKLLPQHDSLCEKFLNDPQGDK